MTTDLHIRKAVPADIELIEDMIAALCAFHNDTYQPNPNAIIRDIFGPQAGARVFFGERQGTAVVLRSAGMNLVCILVKGVCAYIFFMSKKRTLKPAQVAK